MLRMFSVILLFTLPAVAEAQVYRCTDAGGKTEYRQEPCGDARKQATVTIDPPPAATPASRRQAREERAETARGAESATPAPQPIPAPAAPIYPSDVVACLERARDRLIDPRAAYISEWRRLSPPFSERLVLSIVARTRGGGSRRVVAQCKPAMLGGIEVTHFGEAENLNTGW